MSTENVLLQATMPARDHVATTRTFDGVEEAAHRIIAQVGGMASVLKGARIAVLKPNLVAGRSAATGSTTSFALLAAVADEVRAFGAEPVLCETPGTEYDRKWSWREAVILVLSFFPYQWVLGLGALRAVFRHVAGASNWEKTVHLGRHRDASTLAAQGHRVGEAEALQVTP